MMANQLEDKKGWGETKRKKIITTVFIVSSISFAVYFFLLGHLIDIDSPIIGGPKHLEISDNIGHMTIKRAFKSLELFFDEPFNLADGHQIVRVTKEGKFKVLTPINSEVRKSGDGKKLIIQLKDDNDSITDTRLFINFRGSGRDDFPTRKYISKVMMDGKEISLTSFYKNDLDLGQSKINYYKSFTIQNLSNYGARKWGMPLLSIVMGILIILVAGQVIIFFLAVTESLIFKDKLEIGENASIPINWLDIISERYSTFLGFLGTVVSLWVALERSGMDFSNFFELLDILKYAVFTTVLGLVTRSIYGMREFLYVARRQTESEGDDE